MLRLPPTPFFRDTSEHLMIASMGAGHATDLGLDPSKRRRANSLLVLTILLAIAFCLRCLNLNREGLWLDEIWSMEFSSSRSFAEEQLPRDVVLREPAKLTSLKGALPVWKIWTSLQMEPNPPLYYT